MSRVLMEGFEVSLAGYSVYGNCSLSTTTKRSGERSLRVAYGTNDDRTVMPLGSSLSECYGRAAVRFVPDAAGHVHIGLTGDFMAGGQCSLSISSSRVLRLRYAGNDLAFGTTVLSPDTWYLIEWYYKRAERVAVRIDGGPHLDINYYGSAPTAYVTGVSCGVYSSATSRVAYFDDVAVNSTSGSTHNSWCGPGRIIYLPVDGDDTPQQWSTYPENVDHYSVVDDVPANDDTDYIHTDQTGKVDAFTLGIDTALDGKDIWFVRPIAVARKTDASSANALSVGIRSGTTEDYSSATSLITSWRPVRGTLYETDPDTGNPWTYEGLGALKILVKTESAS